MAPLACRYAVEVFGDITVADGISRKRGAEIDAANDDALGVSTRAL
jgi:hypothetical protein